MERSDLPMTTHVVAHYNPTIIAEALALVIHNKPFTHMGIIKGALHFTQILAPEDCPSLELVPLPGHLWPQHMARELERLTNTNKARYENPPRESMTRGWEIRQGLVGRTPIVVAHAKWI